MQTTTDTRPRNNDTQPAHPTLLGRAWELDPEGSVARFEVPNFWGLAKVRGRFGRLRGGLDLRDPGHPTGELQIDATSLDTASRRRDEHLRSPDFFDVGTHPEVSFVVRAATVAEDGTEVKLSGELSAAGHAVSLTLEARVVGSADGLELSVETELDQRLLGMAWSPLGMVRPSSRLFVSARLVSADRPVPGSGAVHDQRL